MLKTNLAWTLSLVLTLGLLGVGSAQDDPADAETPESQTSETQAADNPVAVRIEAYIVSVVTAEDGTQSESFSESTTGRPGQVVEYRVFATNEGETTLPAKSVMVTGPIPQSSTYVDGSATPTGDTVDTMFSLDSEGFSASPETTEGPSAYRAVRWTVLEPLEPGQTRQFNYRVTIN